jgi:hypothetical protein
MIKMMMMQEIDVIFVVAVVLKRGGMMMDRKVAMEVYWVHR